MADDHPLHQHADDHDENRASEDRGDKGVRVAIGQPAGIAAKHEHGAVSEIENAEHAVDDGQADETNASKAPSTKPLKHCDMKLAQLIIWSRNSGQNDRDAAPRAAEIARGAACHVGIRCSRRGYSRTRPVSASAGRPAPPLGPPSSPPCSSCPWAPCP